MKGNYFVFDCVEGLFYKCHKVSLNRDLSAGWLKNQKATINPRNINYEKCFKYVISAPLNHEKIKKDLQRI